MRKLTLKEKEDLRKEYIDLQEPIVVNDFESALKRCEQKFAHTYDEHIKQIGREYMAKKRNDPNSRQKQYDRQYLDDILKGKRNPPCAEKTREFVKKAKYKYGSLSLSSVYQHLK